MALPDLSFPKEIVQKFTSQLSPQNPPALWMGAVVVWPQTLASQGAGDAALVEWRAEEML